MPALPIDSQMTKTKTLKDLKPGDRGKVLRITGQGELKHRLMEMGLVRGTLISVKKLAPLGDPIEIELKGYSLSLRRQEASHIIVE